MQAIFRAQFGDISIHAPRTGSDAAGAAAKLQLLKISIHAPRTGSDRGAAARSGGGFRHFNPRSPHGERRTQKTRTSREMISIHAPRTGSDKRCWKDCCSPANFNPRSPHGERLLALTDVQRHVVISIHAPRTGSDPTGGAAAPSASNFNPRSPHGERRHCAGADGRPEFQSTLPARGATDCL